MTTRHPALNAGPLPTPLVADLTFHDQVALHALIALIRRVPSHMSIQTTKVVEEAYALADAMLAARARRRS